MFYSYRVINVLHLYFKQLSYLAVGVRIHTALVMSCHMDIITAFYL